MTTNNAVNNSLSGQTGTGSFVGSISPTFTGTPVLPTPFTVGATSVTSTGTQLNLLNGLTVVPINKVVTQVFTSNGTYTPTTGMKYCIIECFGPGGGGGGAALSTIIGSAGGGGSGSYSKKTVSAATIGVSQTVTIGTGGAGGSAGNNAGVNGSSSTSVGTICVANAGGGGGGSGANLSGQGGTAAIAGTGDLAFKGNYGYPGCSATTTIDVELYQGQGGIGPFGGGAAPQVVGVATGGTTGNAGNNYGAGGNGGGSSNSSANAAGGAGGAGIAIITEFLSS